MDEKRFCMVMITAPDAKTGENIARVLLEEKLAACVNIVGGVKSMYWWDGQIERADECLLMVKTAARHVERIAGRTKKLHPYKLPEIISVEITHGSADYLGWIDSSVS